MALTRKRQSTTPASNLISFEAKKRRLCEHFTEHTMSVHDALSELETMKLSICREDECTFLALILESLFHISPSGNFYQYCK